MPKPTKTAISKPAKPAKTQAKKPTKLPGARAAMAVAEKKPLKPLTRAPVRRKPDVSLEQRRCYVEVAAYFTAERHGFTSGREHEDWVAAETEIDRMIAEGLLRTK